MTEQERVELLKQVAKACEKAGIRAEYLEPSEENPRQPECVRFYESDHPLCGLLLIPHPPVIYTDMTACAMMLEAIETAGHSFSISSPWAFVPKTDIAKAVYSVCVFSSEQKGFSGKTLPEPISRAFVAVFGEEE